MSGMKITIRSAGPDDAAAIATIHEAAVRGATVEACYGQAQIDAWARPRDSSRLREQLSSRLFFIAAAQGQPIGYAQLDPKAATVRSVYVLPSLVRQGVGRRLVQTMLQVAREAGVARLQLDSSLNAVSFYESLGFRRLDEVDHELRSGAVLRCVRMERPLGDPESDLGSAPRDSGTST